MVCCGSAHYEHQTHLKMNWTMTCIPKFVTVHLLIVFSAEAARVSATLCLATLLTRSRGPTSSTVRLATHQFPSTYAVQGWYSVILHTPQTAYAVAPLSKVALFCYCARLSAGCGAHDLSIRIAWQSTLGAGGSFFFLHPSLSTYVVRASGLPLNFPILVIDRWPSLPPEALVALEVP